NVVATTSPRRPSPLGAELMEPRTPSPRPQSPPPDGSPFGTLQGGITSIRSRILGGLILALPIVLTFWILYWLYATIQGVLVAPMVLVYVHFIGHAPPALWHNVAAPITAVLLVLSSLYVLGLFVHTSIVKIIDWIMLHVPIVTPIYKSLSNVFQSLANQMQNQRHQRVVLVEFPHPGARALAFVTNTHRDVQTDKTILSVCVLTGVMPPAGFTLFVPEESVTDIGWTVNQALQAILSGGMTAPGALHYYSGLHVSDGTGPIVDPHGHPIEPLPEAGESKPV
ncbi:DUF502 domain-containing protein, partial [Singulisphaera rosea]